jgi:hypothetical protein
LKSILHKKFLPILEMKEIYRPDPSAQTAPITRQALPVLLHSPSAASLARWMVSRWTSE